MLKQGLLIYSCLCNLLVLGSAKVHSYNVPNLLEEEGGIIFDKAKERRFGCEGLLVEYTERDSPSSSRCDIAFHPEGFMCKHYYSNNVIYPRGTTIRIDKNGKETVYLPTNLWPCSNSTRKNKYCGECVGCVMNKEQLARNNIFKRAYPDKIYRQLED